MGSLELTPTIMYIHVLSVFAFAVPLTKSASRGVREMNVPQDRRR